MSANPSGRSYQLIDADTHVNEPPDLWTSRVAAEYRDRAPRIERFDEGDAWVLEGVDDPINFGFNATAGMAPEDTKAWVPFEDIRAGGWDPAARLREMDMDLIDAAVLYPTPRLSHAVIATQDPAFHLARVSAYNDWICEYAAHDPSRLGAIVLLPNRGRDMALAELDRLAGRPEVKGVLVGCWPHGDVRWYDAPKRMLQLIWSGVFARHPGLTVVVAEVDAGWVPYFKEQIDDRYLRLGRGAGVSLERPPSSYVEDHFMFTYIVDGFGIRHRHEIGVETMMWSSDYPHVPSDWPHSWRRLEADFSGVPRSERNLITAGNAQRLYRFGATP
jgi:predicted TIM-barrel fold metal-dependent hydrolase